MAEEYGQVVEEDEEEQLDPEREARRQLALAQIRQWGDAALRMKARPVEAFDAELAKLARRMIALMHDASGIGLAATQIGIVRRVFVFQADPESEAQAIVNPSLAEASGELETAEEGCLSLQGVRVPVARHPRVTLEGRDLGGGEVRLGLEGLGARVAQHEIDHLDGVLILDRTTPEARRAAMAILRPQPVLVSL